MRCQDSCSIPQNTLKDVGMYQQCSAQAGPFESMPWCVERLAFRRLIGRGYASRVWECVDQVNGARRAVKVYRKGDLCSLNLHQIQREALIHSSIAHPCVLPFFGSFSDVDHVYMILDYCAKGDLYNYLRAKRRSLTDSQVSKYVIKPFLETLAHLHANGIVHRDIKPENILVSDAGTLLLADFGLSIRAREDRPVTRVGTLDYMAPEVVRCPRKSHPSQWKERADLAYGSSVDIWALGVLAYELTVGSAPFVSESKEQVHNAIVSKEPHMPSHLPDHCIDFMRQCLRKDAAARPSAEELYSHPWVAKFTNGQSVFHNSRKPEVALAAPAHGPALPRSPDRCIQDAVRDCAASVRLATEAIQESAGSAGLDAAPLDATPAPATENFAEKQTFPELTESQSAMSVASAIALDAAAVPGALEPTDSSKILAWHAHGNQASPAAEPQPARVSVPRPAGFEDGTGSITGVRPAHAGLAASPGELAPPLKGVATPDWRVLELSKQPHAHL